jgi:hypothetical protein
MPFTGLPRLALARPQRNAQLDEMVGALAGLSGGTNWRILDLSSTVSDFCTFRSKQIVLLAYPPQIQTLKIIVSLVQVQYMIF